MAGRFPHGDSGSQSPASANTPISYRTNVNRQKTKKWAEAKPADYGGDDWGDDDYDPPPAVPRVTGLRQQGQALNNALPKLDMPSTAAKKDYGDLPPVPNSAPATRPRVNSFDADDERRNFSGQARQTSPQPTSATAPPTRFSQITGVPSTRSPVNHVALAMSSQPSQPPVTGLRKAITTPPPSGPAPPDANPLGRTSTGASSVTSSSGPPSDYQSRRDFSPSQQPPPLQSRVSPEPPAIRIPAQGSGTIQSKFSDSAQASRAPEDAGAAKAQPTSPSSAAAAQTKALPFIRPADIYRRMEEERERERQSMDSNRPSMDAVTAAKPTERAESPAQARQTAEPADGYDPGRLRSHLEPVRERKSEYGFDGFQLNDPTGGSDRLDSPDYAAHDKLGSAIERRQSTSPQLPNLSRMSGFGMDFLSQSSSEDPAPPTSQPSTALSTVPEKKGPSDVEEHPLRSEPSLGFTSAVNQAFDRSDKADDGSLPPTPASRSADGIKRSESESTNTTGGISPIMSRLPSIATPGASRNPDVTIDSVASAAGPESLPTVRESTEGQRPSEPAASAAVFKPGHRRDMSTPSPGNSPARTPDLSQSKDVPNSQEAVVSEASPESAGETVPFKLQTGGEQSSRPSDDTQGPQRNVSLSEERNEKFDINPTTTKRALPHSPSEAAVVDASVVGIGGVVAGEHDRSPSVAAKSENAATEAATPAAKQEEAPTTAPKDGPLETAKSEVIPIVTMDSTSIDEQNDRLHKDIVKRLSSPGLLNADDEDKYDQTRISSYLPSEYENYWAASAEEETPLPLAPSPKRESAQEPASQASPAAATDSVAKSEPEPVQPLSPQKPEQEAPSLVSPLSRRYSWEATPESTPVVKSDPQSPRDATQADRDVRQSVSSDPKLAGSVAGDSEYHADLALAAGGLAFAGAFGAMHGDSESNAGQRVSSVDENGNRSSNPALLSPRDGEQHDGSSQSPTGDRLSSHSASGSAPPSRASQAGPTAKIPTFKEISAIESTQQRIKTFDETRQRFAAMDSGLGNWMGALKAQIPEHADVTSAFRGSGVGGMARPKVAGNGPAQPAYYQQYLNASSPTAPVTPAARPGLSAPSGTQQGFSPGSAGKLASQQVQAKGKELLHTAGIFGGKAGKAGKGLLAKGKSRLRGGDKTSGSLNSRLGRRSSWGLPRDADDRDRSGSRSPTGPSHRRRASASTLTLDTHPAHPHHRPTMSDAMSAPGNPIAPWTVLEAFPVEPHSSPPPMPALPPMLKADGRVSVLSDSGTIPIPNTIPISFDRVTPAGPAGPPLDGFAPENRDLYYQTQQQQQPPIVPQEPVPAPPAPEPPSPMLAVADPSSVGNGQDAGEDIDAVVEPSEDVRRDLSTAEPEMEPAAENQPRQQASMSSSAAQQPSRSLSPRSDPPPEMRLTKAAGELTVPPSTAKTRSRGYSNSSTSILDRPRYSYDIPRPSDLVLSQSQPQTLTSTQSSSTSARPQPPSFFFPSLMDPPARSHLGVGVGGGLVVGHGHGYYRAEDAGREPPSRRDSKSENSFEGLPPIRRISGIGFDFNPLHADSDVSLPSAGDGEHVTRRGAEAGTEVSGDSGERDSGAMDGDGEIDPFAALQRHSYAEDSQAEIFAAFRAAAGLHEEDGGRGPPSRPSQPQTPLRQPPGRPAIPYAVSPMHSIDPLRRQREQKAAAATTGGHLDVAAHGDEHVRMSEDVARAPPPFAPPQGVPGETQHRFSIGASPSTPRAQVRSPNSARDGENQEGQWRNSWTPQQQPPSSAQRYPELFQRPPVPMGHGPADADDMPPPQYFHNATPQVSAFIPRQQPTEYQIPGVGPPNADRPGSRRGSGFFKEIGDRIRSGSRDEGNRASRDGSFMAEKNMNVNYDDTDSSIVSDDGPPGPRPVPGRSNFYARAPPVPGSMHESMVAHPAGSRSNLPLSNQTSPTAQHDRKKTGFRTSISADPVPPVPPLPKTAGFGGLTVPEDGGKKKRFSGLSSMFGKSANHSSKSSVSDASRERPSMDPPPQALLPKQAQILGTGPQNRGTPPKTFLSRLTAGGEQPTHARKDSQDIMAKLGIGVGDAAPAKRDAKPQREPKPARDSKPRKKSAAGLLTGIMNRRGTQADVPEEPPSIRSKTIGPPIYHPPAFLSERPPPSRSQADRSPAMTQQSFSPSPPPMQPGDREGGRDRGRSMSKDRPYPGASTPNGYTPPLRGEGATPARADFDPRNPRNLQQGDGRFPPPSRQPTSPLNGPQLYGQSQQSSQDLSYSQGSRSPNLTIESSEGSQRRELRRLSREDILARSPARSPEGQQRPYQLALPENEDGGLPRPLPMNNEVPIISPPRKNNRSSAIPLSQPETAQVAIIQRLIHPALRDSPPNSRPLSDDDVFSTSSGKDDPERGNSKAQIVLGLSPRIPSKRDEEAILPPVPAKPGQEGMMGQRMPSKLVRDEEAMNRALPNKPVQEEEVPSQRMSGKTLREEEVLAPVDALDKEMGARTEFTPSPSPPTVETPRSRQGRKEPERRETERREPERRERERSEPERREPERREPERREPERREPERREPQRSRESSRKPADMRIPIPEPKPSPDLYNASPRLPRVETPTPSHVEDDGVGKDDKEVTEGGGSSMHIVAELDDPESEMLKRARGKGEEKIPAEEGMLDVDNEPVTMSATSYPGQEWNPYADGSYEDFD